MHSSHGSNCHLGIGSLPLMILDCRQERVGYIIVTVVSVTLNLIQFEHLVEKSKAPRGVLFFTVDGLSAIG